MTVNENRVGGRETRILLSQGEVLTFASAINRIENFANAVSFQYFHIAKCKLRQKNYLSLYHLPSVFFRVKFKMALAMEARRLLGARGLFNQVENILLLFILSIAVHQSFVIA